MVAPYAAVSLQLQRLDFFYTDGDAQYDPLEMPKLAKALKTVLMSSMVIKSAAMMPGIAF